MAIRFTHQQFLDKLAIKNSYFAEGKFKVIGNYENVRAFIKVESEIGIHLVLTGGVYAGYMPASESLVDRYKYLHKRLTKDCQAYREGEFKLVKAAGGNNIIIDTEFGKCKVSIYQLINGSSTSIRAAVDRTEYLKNQLKKKWGDTYDFSNVVFKTGSQNVEVICKKHGHFTVGRTSLLKGHGCNSCGVEKTANINREKATGWAYTKWEEKANLSQNFDSFKVYIIKCWNGKEEFYKIGKTFVTLKNRYRGKPRMPYNYEIIKLIEGEAREICKLEKKLQKENKEYKYLPNIPFGGYGECFSKINIKKLG